MSAKRIAIMMMEQRGSNADTAIELSDSEDENIEEMIFTNVPQNQMTSTNAPQNQQPKSPICFSSDEDSEDLFACEGTTITPTPNILHQHDKDDNGGDSINNLTQNKNLWDLKLQIQGQHQRNMILL